MPNVMPEKEVVKKAIKWISTNIQENAGRPLQKIIDEAVFKFDLSPMDVEFLRGFFSHHSEKS